MANVFPSDQSSKLSFPLHLSLSEHLLVVNILKPYITLKTTEIKGYWWSRTLSHVKQLPKSTPGTRLVVATYTQSLKFETSGFLMFSRGIERDQWHNIIA